MKTFLAKKEDIKRKWHVVNADGKILGRMATRVAIILRGKDKPVYTPNIDCGDGVIIVNAEKIAVTGNKLQEKTYSRFSGYPGGLKKKNLSEMLSQKPGEVLRQAVWGMIPHNKLGRDMMKKLKIYAGPKHPHEALKPLELVITKERKK